MRIWTVRLKKTVSPSEGLIEGAIVALRTQQDTYDYAELQRAVKCNGKWRFTDDIWSDDYWEWK